MKKPQNSIKTDSQACACGKVDLYGEWLKQQQSTNEEISNPAEPSQADCFSNSDDDIYNKDKNSINTNIK